MKRLKTKISLLVLTASVVGLFSYCTKHDQVLNLAPAANNTTASTTLTSVKGTATVLGPGAGIWNGAIESAWANAPALALTPTVPTPGNNIFTGFNGNSTNLTIQSMYDASNIYFLVQWQADQNSCANSPWYYNPTTSRWAQETAAPVLNADGTTFRPPFNQDEYVMMFNINKSCTEFVSQSCYGACHVFSSYGGANTPAGGAMWTNGPTEFLDCWRARTLQVLNENQANDCAVTWDGGTLNKQSVPADAQVKTTDGGFSNKQTLTITGKKIKVSVPEFVYPTGTYSIYPNMSSGPFGAILIGDTSSKAIKVTAVDSNGVLTLANGSTIDPRTAANGTNYQQVGSGDGLYCIPGSVVAPYTGSRGDVTANMFYTGTGWKLLLKRALKTSDTVYDVDFSPLTDQAFGLGVMFNGADNEHAIVTGLNLTFQK